MIWRFFENLGNCIWGVKYIWISKTKISNNTVRQVVLFNYFFLELGIETNRKCWRMNLIIFLHSLSKTRIFSLKFFKYIFDEISKSKEENYCDKYVNSFTNGFFLNYNFLRHCSCIFHYRHTRPTNEVPVTYHECLLTRSNF